VLQLSLSGSIDATATNTMTGNINAGVAYGEAPSDGLPWTRKDSSSWFTLFDHDISPGSPKITGTAAASAWRRRRGDTMAVDGGGASGACTSGVGT
jgi:hypothetical protein